MAMVKLRILGECVIEVGDRCIGPESPQLFGFLLYLGVQSGRFSERAQLSELLFSNDFADSQSSAHNLRQLLYRARRLGAPINATPTGLAIESSEIENSLHAFLKASYVERVQSFVGSIDILPCFQPSQPSFVSWLDSFRDRCHGDIRRILHSDLTHARECGDWHTVESLAKHLLALDPVNETGTLTLAEALARRGSKTTAIALLESYESQVKSRGKQLELPAQLLRKRVIASAQQASGAPPHTSSFVGRKQELQQLLDTWRRAQGGTFAVISLTGEKSIGKSRIVGEFTAALALEGKASVVSATALSHDKDRPLSIFGTLVGQLLKVRGAAGCDPAALAILRRLTASTTPTGPIGTTYSDAHFDEASIRNALADLLSSISEERALACIVDDCHHLDPESLALLGALQAQRPDCRVMLILAGRSERTTLIPAIHSTLCLHSLSTEHATQLLSETLMRLSAPANSARFAWMLEVGSGNPGHIELLAESGTPTDPPTPPHDIVALYDERIALLSERAQHVLLAISIVSDGASGEALGVITGLNAFEVLSTINELARNSLIKEGARGVVCRSSIVEERSLKSAPLTVAALLHERAAALLESTADPSSDVGKAWRIATHWRAANQRQRARACLRACWQQAINIGRPMTAAQSIRSELPFSCDPVDHAALLDDLIGALQAAGESAAVQDVIRERQSLSRVVNDAPPRVVALAFDFLQATILAQAARAGSTEELRYFFSNPQLDPARRISAGRLLMIAADVELDEQLSKSTFEGAIEVVAPDRASQVLQQHIALFYHTVYGDRETALSLASSLEEMVSRDERSWLKYATRVNCSLARFHVGEDLSATERAIESYFECVDASMTAAALTAAAHIAGVYFDNGNITRASEWQERARELAATAQQPDAALHGICVEIDLALVAGDESRARSALKIMHEHPRHFSSARLRNDRFVYSLRVEQMCDGSFVVSDRDMTELLRYHHRAKRLGRHDDHMDVLWVALSARGQSALASELLQDYLRVHRRERRLCRFMLRRRTASDPAWLASRDSALPTR